MAICKSGRVYVIDTATEPRAPYLSDAGPHDLAEHLREVFYRIGLDNKIFGREKGEWTQEVGDVITNTKTRGSSVFLSLLNKTMEMVLPSDSYLLWMYEFFAGMCMNFT